MKKLTLISSAIAVVLLFTLSSCGVSNKSVAQLDDMYYSPSAAKHQARIDDRNRKRELAEREANGEFEQTPGTSFQSSSNINEGGNQNSAYYEDEYRMNYGSYFSRFGNGYHHNPYMRQPRMMYSPGFSFWTGYNNFGMGYGMGYGNPMMMGGYYDPFCPWGGGMGMGMMGYNPYHMNPHMGMGGYGMNSYNNGFMNGYMYGTMAGGNSFGGGGGSSYNQRPQPVIARRQSYGSNQSVVNRNRNSAAYGSSNSPNTNNTVQSRGTTTGTSTGTATRGSSTPSDRRTSTTPARTTVRGSGSSPTPSRSTAPAPTRTPSRSYNQPAPRTPSSPSYSTPSRGGSGGGRSTGGSTGGSSGGGSRGGRR